MLDALRVAKERILGVPQRIEESQYLPDELVFMDYALRAVRILQILSYFGILVQPHFWLTLGAQKDLFSSWREEPKLLVEDLEAFECLE